MDSLIRIVPPGDTVEFFGIRLVGVSLDSAKKLLLTAILVAVVLLIGRLLQLLARWIGRETKPESFWIRQSARLLVAIFLFVGLASIWFDDPSRFATAAGLVTAGLAFALQKVITAIAGYFVILHGRTFRVGDRIVMGGVRGDVIGVGFIQTTIMEMGETPSEQKDAPSIWIEARQYTGRIVTVSNAHIFNEPVYNYTRDFPYIWEEMRLPISFRDDRQQAESILLDVAKRHTVTAAKMSAESLAEMRRRFALKPAFEWPRVYLRITDNWVELTVRFVVEDHGIREVKDAMSRDILSAFDEAGIGIASSTFEIVGLPPLHVENDGSRDGKIREFLESPKVT